MALPAFTMRQLLEAGVHFGHQTQYWNPKMEQFIYGQRNGIHIFDLTQTFPMLHKALEAIHEVVSKNGRVLFVGTKRQAQGHVLKAADESAQYFMNHRWLGGTLTNWHTISNSIKYLKNIEERMEQGMEGLTKKERLNLERERNKLQASLGGIREMGTLPDIIFVIDVKRENLAVREAKKCGIPVVGIVDTNSSPENIDYLIPGNDDAGRSIELYCDLVARTIIDAMSQNMSGNESDIVPETLPEGLRAETNNTPSLEDAAPLEATQEMPSPTQENADEPAPAAPAAPDKDAQPAEENKADDTAVVPEDKYDTKKDG